MNRHLLIIISVVLLISLAIILVISLNNQRVVQLSNLEKKNEMINQANDNTGDQISREINESTHSSFNKTTPKYVAYSQNNLDEIRENNSRAVIFFHAAWCPFCKEAEEEFLQNPSQIPADVTILKADYDTETELKNKYTVVNQHTFVQIDSAGNELKKWFGGGITAMLQNLQEAELPKM
jgi:thiol:disulfide interchange protein